ncbi:MAG: CAP domain-containing protein [Sandaracinus sp.]|nr:CAP domain-containing protein [Sandaracinus sp.]
MNLRLTLALVASLLALVACGDGGSGPDCGGDEGSEVCEVFRLVNVERRAAGLEPYVWDSHLATAAQRHAVDMSENDYFSHSSQDGRSFVDRAGEAGYDASPRGENIAQGYRNAAAVMEGWMSSDGHRANILAEGSNEIGIGLRDFYWVQVFGTRRE